MSGTAVLLMVATALGFATLDFLRKRLTEHCSVLPLLFVLTIFVLPLYGLWLWIDGELTIASGYWLPALASLLLNVFANISFLRAMQMSGLSVTIPLLSLTPVFTTLSSMPLLGEVLDLPQVLGVSLVVIGALWLQLDGGAGSRNPVGSRLGGWLFALTREKGGLLMMAVALAWSFTTPFDKLALENASVAFHASVLNLGVGVTAFGLMLARGEAAQLVRLRQAKGLLVAAVLCGGAALGFQLLALEQVFAGVLETFKRGVGSVSAVVLGVLVLRETMSASKAVAVVMMSAGVALLLL